MARPQGLLYFMGLGTKGVGQRWKEGRMYLEWRRKYAKQLRKFKDIHAGEDCFIIGNGPSLNKMDLSPLKDYYTFGLNKIYMIFDKVDLDLSYLVSANEYVIEQSKEVFENFHCPLFLSYTASRGVVDDRPNIHRLYTLNTWSFYEDISQPICNGFTVTYVAMQIAYYMGFKRVFLIGVDHSFKQTQNAENTTEVLKGEDENHFHPDYFKGMKWHLADVKGNEVSYHMADYFFVRDERLILDATVGGKLDVFPKIAYEEALSMAKKKKP
jgi:hypothetical protein